MSIEKREIKLNYATGSREAKFAELMEKYVGKTRYMQEFDDEKAGKITSEREYITNEYGGTNTMHMLDGIVTLRKRDAQGVVKEIIEQELEDFEM